jgi:hypothetical protein
MVLVILLVILKKNTSVTLGELFNPQLKKIEGKVNHFMSKGFNINITYLYYKGNQKDIQKNIEIFKEIINYLDDKYEDEQDIFKRGKVSVKLIQMGNTPEERLKNFTELVNHAFSKNIFIWISAFHYKQIEEERNTYLFLKERGYINLGITIACYHEGINSYVDLILYKGGNIRLVKGYYNDGTIKNWDIVTKNYLNNAKKIIKDSNYHQLATHDIKNILAPLNKIKDLNTKTNIEMAFFVNSVKHLKREFKKYNLKINNKCMFLVFGKKFSYIRTNIRHISFERLLRVKNII